MHLLKTSAVGAQHEADAEERANRVSIRAGPTPAPSVPPAEPSLPPPPPPLPPQITSNSVTNASTSNPFTEDENSYPTPVAAAAASNKEKATVIPPHIPPKTKSVRESLKFLRVVALYDCQVRKHFLKLSFLM
jgi:hypothetical protein